MGREGGMKKLKTKVRIHAAVYHIFCILLVFVMIYPLLWLMFSAFKEKGDIFGNLKLIPEKWIFENFVNGWRGFGGVSFAVFFKNSFIGARLSIARV